MAVEFTEAWLSAYLARKDIRARRRAPSQAAAGGRAGSEPGQKKKAETEGGSADRPARRKYGNQKTALDGRVFDSRHEADAYARLALETKAGAHYAVFCQVAFPLPGGVKYVADFVTLEADGTYTVYDAKSEATARDKVYRLKKRQMEACNHIEIHEI